MTLSSLSDFIYVADGALEPEFCEHVIEKFEADEGKYQGQAGGIVNVSLKDSTDLMISRLEHWREEDETFFRSLEKHQRLYLEGSDWKVTPGRLVAGVPNDTGYQIQRTSPGGGYDWHHDSVAGSRLPQEGVRFSTFIWKT